MSTESPTSAAAPALCTRGSWRRERSGCVGWLRCSRNGFRAAQAAFVVGLLIAAVSVYWGLGGAWLLDTVGGSLEKQGWVGYPSVMIAIWAAVVLKVIAAVLPLLALHRLTSPAWDPAVWVLAWIEAAILTIYGLVLTAVGLLVQAGVIHASASADHRALAWHADLWDPGFSSGVSSSSPLY